MSRQIEIFCHFDGQMALSDGTHVGRNRDAVIPVIDLTGVIAHTQE
jgi:hypothetical protein